MLLENQFLRKKKRHFSEKCAKTSWDSIDIDLLQLAELQNGHVSNSSPSFPQKKHTLQMFQPNFTADARASFCLWHLGPPNAWILEFADLETSGQRWLSLFFPTQSSFNKTWTRRGLEHHFEASQDSETTVTFMFFFPLHCRGVYKIPMNLWFLNIEPGWATTFRMNWNIWHQWFNKNWTRVLKPGVSIITYLLMFYLLMSRFKWFEMIWMPKFHAKLENQHKQICNSKWPRLWLKGAACAQGVGLHICMFNLNISVGFCWLTHLLSLRHGFFDFLPNVFRPINVSDHRQIAKGMTSSWAKDEPSSKESRKAQLNSCTR